MCCGLQMAEFPGFSENSSTPLPESLNSNNILKTVVRAQTDLQRKVRFCLTSFGHSVHCQLTI